LHGGDTALAIAKRSLKDRTVVTDPPLWFAPRASGPNELPSGGAVGAADLPTSIGRAYFWKHRGL